MASNGAIQIHAASEAITPFAPQGLEQAMRLAEVLSKSGLLPDALRNKPSDVLVTLITGHELGLSPMQSVRGLHVVQGRAVMSADLTVALVMRRRDVCEWFRLVKSDDKAAEYQTKRVGSEPVTMSYTFAQATTAGLTGKQNWKTHTAAMLRARCSAALARAVYPDLVLGVYDPDEAEEFKAPVRVTAPPPPAAIEGEVVIVEHPAEPAETVVDPADALAAKVREAESVSALEALLPAIQTAKKAGVDVATVREAYSARRKELAS